MNPLTPEEKHIIAEKGTEPPGSGRYDEFFESGVYLCRRCDAPLYRSEDKFQAHCGWPSFDDELPGAVKKKKDADGMRTEIQCSHCGAHLGHIFTGENLTEKNARHCVNSLSLHFIPYDFSEGATARAVFGGGCFWCVESVFSLLRGVTKTVSGYAGGMSPTSYEAVSSGTTEHREVVEISYDPKIISYETLLRVFFFIHDPTSRDKQDADAGSQYRSVIFYLTEKQRREARSILSTDKKIVTELHPLYRFYPAEEYHQKYFTKNPNKPYCQLVIAPKMKKFREEFSEFLSD